MNVDCRRLFIGVFLATFAAMEPAFGADDLHGLYLAAKASDPSLEAARLQVQVAAEKLVQARAAFLPSLGLNAGLNHQRGMASFNRAEEELREARSSSWLLQLSQPLWRPGISASLAQAQLQLQRAAQLHQQAQAELMLRVSQAYFDVLVAQKNAAVSQAQVNAVRQQLSLARRNFEGGLTTVTDVHEAQARLALAQAQWTASLTDLAARMAEMEKLVGRQLPVRPRALHANAPWSSGLEDEQAWIAAALANHPAVRSQQLALESAEQEIGRAESSHGPTLEATAGYGRNTAAGSLTSPTELASRSRSAQLGLQFRLPLYAGGSLRSQTREAVAQRDRARAELDAAQRQLTAQVRQSFTGTANGQAQIQALEDAARASRAAVEANKVGYRIGTRLNIDVLNAEQQQFMAERDLYKARADTIMHYLRLRAAGARLEPEDLRTISDLLKEE